MASEAQARFFFPEDIPAPSLLIELRPWFDVFGENLADLVLRREPPPVEITARPADFWPDVFVGTGADGFQIARSAFYHAMAIGLVVAFSYLPLTTAPFERNRYFENHTITYYEVSEYLPALTAPTPVRPKTRPLKGNPEFARQEIISVPPRPDNSTQTVVDPHSLRMIENDVLLPNVMAQPVLPRPPVDLANARLNRRALNGHQPILAPPPEIQRRIDAMRMNTVAQVVAAAPALPERNSRRDLDLRTKVVEAAPDLPAASNLRLPQAPRPAIVQPPADPLALARRPGQINIGKNLAPVAAPRMPVPEQRVSLAEVIPPVNASAPPPVAAAPSQAAINAAGGGAQRAGRMMALNVRPMPPAPAITLPEGNRSGVFAATPQGIGGAPGTPDIAGDKHSDQLPSAAIPGGGTRNTDVAGLRVSQPPQAPSSNAPVVQRPPVNPALLATIRRPTVSELANQTHAVNYPAPDPSRIEERIFGLKKYYSLTLNMPNLTSASGSWIIRFAELGEQHSGDLNAPVALSKVDPGYPAELARSGVQGTVVLYAVIHSDGKVGEIRILQSVDDRLDDFARQALQRWTFRPATRNGRAVDLEAVVQIPFNAPSKVY